MSDIPPPPGSQPVPPPPGSQPTPPPPPGNMAPPAGYVAYGAAPTPTGSLSRVGGVSKAAMILVALSALATAAVSVVQKSLTSDAEAFLDGRISDSEFTDSIGAFGGLSILSGVLLLAAGVLTMISMYRITSNIRAYGISTTWHPLWAVFGWFLPPFILYIIPFLMFREQWKKSSQAAVSGGDDSSGENPVLWAWFVLWGIVPLVMFALRPGSLFQGLESDSESIAENLRDAGDNALINGSVGLLAGLVFAFFLSQLSARHRSMTGER